MTRSLEGIQLRLAFSATLKNVLTDTERTATAALLFSYNPTIVDGTDEEEANRGWEYSGTLAAAATLVVDLFDLGTLDVGAGAGKDALGQSVALDQIVTIVIMNTSDLADNASVDSDSDSDIVPCLEIEPDASAGWTPIGTHTALTGGALQAGGVLVKMQVEQTAFLVTDGVSHRIKLTARGGEVDFKILVIGREE